MRVYTPLLFVFLVLGPSSINGDTDPNDASALRVLYQSLNSPGQLTKWTANGGDPCGENWKGVTCSGSRVTEINIPSLGLSGNLGYQLTSLTSLNSFDISNNNLGNQLPYNLPPILQRLNIARCGFSGSLPYYISLMKPLKYLNAAHNQLNGELTDMFSTLPSLSTLDLSFNSLTGELPESFSSLSSATNMYLQNNQFTGTIDVLDLGKSATHGTPAMHPHRHLVHLHLEAAIGTANQVETTTTTTRPPVTQVVVERNPASMVELSPES